MTRRILTLILHVLISQMLTLTQALIGGFLCILCSVPRERASFERRHQTVIQLVRVLSVVQQ